MKAKRLAVSVLAITALLVLIVSDKLAQTTTSVFPNLIQLPPEGIAVGSGSTFYVGSLAPATRGQILTGDLRTGTFSQLVPPTGRLAVSVPRPGRSPEFAWSFWTFDWGTPARGEHTVRSRARDLDGNLQPAPDDPFLASRRTYWESNGQIIRSVLIS
jgi:hypothetical protein